MAYGKLLYSTFIYGDQGADAETPEYTIPDLMRYLPWYYQDSKEMLKLQGTVAEEVGALRYDAIPDLLKQFFIKTATWGLDYWENELGLVTNRSNSYVRRREIIQAKLRGSGTSTKERIKGVAIAFSGGEVDVIEYPEDYRFEVKFIGVLGIPPNMAGFLAMLDEIKPAHLGYSISYTYTVWNMVKPLIWNEAGTRNWGQLRTYGG
ncbi:putative phage tail protein [Sporomusa sp.]|uniref:putative phage tail protein n=1 Tax=Sporomusa sp. TaxID=2078658 RepID=UPI002C22FEE2|nr:putative phage tail protein [Sporomusa sp.]HWR07090.1 putative phage tail protein [Sporomusa sp.]